MNTEDSRKRIRGYLCAAAHWRVRQSSRLVARHANRSFGKKSVALFQTELTSLFQLQLAQYDDVTIMGVHADGYVTQGLRLACVVAPDEAGHA
ncbi:hypothetical protein SAMN04487914_10887 [Arthrobacter sp. ok909]|nr:hypothetical protein SAMN04487914_10887 [Arthrobacter sp. ok909]